MGLIGPRSRHAMAPTSSLRGECISPYPTFDHGLFGVANATLLVRSSTWIPSPKHHTATVLASRITAGGTRMADTELSIPSSVASGVKFRTTT